MPEDGPAEHAANLLRDLKALALGQGKVETGPVGAAVSAGAGKGPGSPRAPPGLEPLLPEGARESWRPPVVESAKADLPPLEKAAELGKALREKSEARSKPERAALEKQAGASRRKLSSVHGRVIAPEQAERRQFADFESVLDRRLKPAERVHVRGLLLEKKTNQQIIATLQNQPDGDDDSDFLKDLARRLMRALSPAEKEQALRLRRQGRTAAEVADILRT
jgi:hypothetical protein